MTAPAVADKQLRLMLEQRCLVCGCPGIDHCDVPLRYMLRSWIRHRTYVWYAEFVLWIRRHA